MHKREHYLLPHHGMGPFSIFLVNIVVECWLKGSQHHHASRWSIISYLRHPEGVLNGVREFDVGAILWFDIAKETEVND